MAKGKGKSDTTVQSCDITVIRQRFEQKGWHAKIAKGGFLVMCKPIAEPPDRESKQSVSVETIPRTV